jgi:hypothetical protein
VAIDDPHLHLLAYTVHKGHVDRVRLASIVDSTLNESTKLALAQGLDRLWKFVTPRHSLRLLRPDHGVVLV